MTSGKDDPRVVKFMASFQRLRELLDDDPKNLETLASTDLVLARLCVEVADLAMSISMNERKRRQLFAAPVDPRFKDAWRDYERTYAAPLAGVWLSDIGLDFVEAQFNRMSPQEAQWRNADEDASDQAKAIETALQFANEQAQSEHRYSGFPRGFPEQITDAIDAWDRLVGEAGLDLRGTFRRRELVPFVLIPRHVSAHHGTNEPVSLLTHLQQAHDAFVFGLHHAAISLMRAVLETCLVRHYHAKGDDLAERIDSISKPPVGVSTRALHRLRQRANEVLHLTSAEPVSVPKDLEREVLSYLYLLRALIEGAPKLPR